MWTKSSDPKALLVRWVSWSARWSMAFPNRSFSLASGDSVSVPFIAAVLVSNILQAIAPSADLAATGWNWRRVAGLWTWVVLACGIASVIGYGAASVVSKVHGARMAAFASGGILAMLSDSLIPFAHERSQGAGLWTVVGFCASFAMG